MPDTALSVSSQVNVGASRAQCGLAKEVELRQPRQDRLTSPRTRQDGFACRQARIDVRGTSASLAVSNVVGYGKVIVPVAGPPCSVGNTRLLSAREALQRCRRCHQLIGYGSQSVCEQEGEVKQKRQEVDARCRTEGFLNCVVLSASEVRRSSRPKHGLAASANQRLREGAAGSSPM